MNETADFSEVWKTPKMRSMGTRPAVIRSMGLKQRAREAMQKCGVPILPGSVGILKSPEEALEIAEQIGYPVMLKASAGGGGRGMRIVREASEMPALLNQAQQEAGA